MKQLLHLFRISDDLWNMVEPMIPRQERAPGKDYRRRPGGGRKPLESRRVFDAIVFVLRTGIPWKGLPTEHYGSSSSIHSYFRLWEGAGFFEELWRKGLAEHDDMAGIAWRWHHKSEFLSEAPPSSNLGELHQANLGMHTITPSEKIWRPVVIRRERCRT
jgi:transposase